MDVEDRPRVWKKIYKGPAHYIGPQHIFMGPERKGEKPKGVLVETGTFFLIWVIGFFPPKDIAEDDDQGFIIVYTSLDGNFPDRLSELENGAKRYTFSMPIPCTYKQRKTAWKRFFRPYKK